MIDKNCEFFIKSLISKETGIDNLDALDEIYKLYMNNDNVKLLSDDLIRFILK